MIHFITPENVREDADHVVEPYDEGIIVIFIQKKN